ncbi:circularly permuted type 2 ATP-grasp protein [Nocardia brasiliensis]|uniref:circularly permuted type 2 ATP-grasp protein n=1 Tax=Nocardia brasiliensis TaxID=37326 RepID=UPI001895B157|nr:circularly permuted type 2 ATP-grasp protein [Nocardia brasiliensis]MBF6545743.1 circularly permuted type 2 ATP-grasp protein [Nocardia brasiliensis]
MREAEASSRDGRRATSAAPGVREQVAEQFARYRSGGVETAPYDECGRPTEGYYDELVDAGGRVRRMWSELSADFVELGTTGLGRLDSRVRRLIEDDGITYTEVTGSGEQAVTTPWRLDPIPLLISADDWTRLEAGLVQRSRVLDEVLTDVYGPRRMLTNGLLPPEVVFGYGGYVRAAHGITVPGRHQLFLHACDISRWSDGRFRVTADWAQAPSGAGYALADRRVVSTAIPEAFEHSNPRPLTPFARAMRLMLIESAPEGEADDPVVVVLSPGVHSETAYDQANLASMLGFPLVESADLVVRDGALWMRSLGTLRRVDVVLRRVDAEFSDPLDLRPDSRLGVVGLVEVLRRGAVTVVNTLGSGLLENPALTGFLPRLAKALLGEDLLLESAPSFWGGDDKERAHLTKNLHRLIIRSAIDGATIFGPALSIRQRAELRARIEASGWQWVGQEPAQFSVAPAVEGYGGLTPAPVGMRLFSMARRGGYTAMAGGLGQLHQRTLPDRVVIKIAAKDIWVRAAPAPAPAVGTEAPHEERVSRRLPIVAAISSPRVLNDLFWMGRYSERAEAAVRLLMATHERYQDFRYRPWLEGAEALPVLMAALARATATVAPAAVLSGTAPDDALSPADTGAGGRPDRAATQTSSSGSRTQTQPGAMAAAQGDMGQAQSMGAPVEPDSTDPQQDSEASGVGAVAGASREGHDYLVALTVDRDLPGSLAFAVDRYANAARAVRDQLSNDTWMILSAVDRAMAEYRGFGEDREAALSAVHSLTLAALLSLSGIGAESLVRDSGWYVMDIGKRIERGLALTALMSAALTRTYPEEAERVVTESVLRAAESQVSYRRRHRDSVRIAAVAGLLLFDTANPRSLAYQLDRLDADLRELPGASGSSRPQRLLADAQRMLRRLDPDDLEVTDDEGRRTELAELLDGVHLRLRKLAESFETAKLALPAGFQPLWGSTRVVG